MNFRFLNAFLPSHLWVDDRKIYHIDYSRWKCPKVIMVNGEYRHNYNKIEAPCGIGYITYAGREYNAEQYIYFMGYYVEPLEFYDFLKEVGGKYEEYKEMVTLTSGGFNPIPVGALKWYSHTPTWCIS